MRLIPNIEIDRWYPEPVRHALRTLPLLVGIVVLAAIISLPIVLLLHLPVAAKAVLFSIMAFIIYAALIIYIYMRPR